MKLMDGLQLPRPKLMGNAAMGGCEWRGGVCGVGVWVRGGYGVSVGLGMGWLWGLCGVGGWLWGGYGVSIGLGVGYGVVMGSLWGWVLVMGWLWGLYGVGVWLWGGYGVSIGLGVGYGVVMGSPWGWHLGLGSLWGSFWGRGPSESHGTAPKSPCTPPPPSRHSSAGQSALWDPGWPRPPAG